MESLKLKLKCYNAPALDRGLFCGPAQREHQAPCASKGRRRVECVVDRC